MIIRRFFVSLTWHVCLLLLGSWTSSSSISESNNVPLRWNLCKNLATTTNSSANKAKEEENQGRWLSTNGPNNDDCIPATVPGTILSNLLAAKNGTFFGFRDAYFETNLQRIPDIADTGRDAWTYFYVATWNETPSEIIEKDHTTSKKHALLTLRSINYQAELWLDGIPVIPRHFPGVPEKSKVKGMFQRFVFPLGTLSSTSSTNGPLHHCHHLAILVHPPYHPGRPGGGQGGSHELAQDGPISQFTGGWDWIQATPDRNTGLWDKVFLKYTGSLHLHDPTVRIRNLDIENQSADLFFSVSIDSRQEVENNGLIQGNSSCCAWVSLEYDVYAPKEKRASGKLTSTSAASFLKVAIPNGASNILAEFPAETITNANLWYPHTHGQPALYQAKFRIYKTSCDSRPPATLHNVSTDDQTFVQFGIRKVEFTVNPRLNGLQLAVNNERVFLQGGNWIASDQFMRFAGDRARYIAEIRLHKAMGLNMIRVWGGGIAERPEFFEVCDELGILVLADFWMSGDDNGRWAGSYGWPLDRSLYLDAVRDTALLLRNHPSLIMYSAGNELYPTDKNPPAEIRKGIERELQDVDPDTFLILSTMTNTSDFNPNESLCPKDGPYGMLEEAMFYERNPGLWDWQNHSHARLNETKIAFQPEIGSASFPTLRSLLRFMSSESAEYFPGYQDTNVHPTWKYHNFLGFTSERNPFAEDENQKGKVDLIYQYGAPMNISEYCLRAQLAQFTQFRSLFESFKLRMWEWYSAVLFWKSQSPWPSLRGGLYDWYLDVTGGYYGVRAALVGGSVHGQMNLADHSLSVVVGSAHQVGGNVTADYCVTVNAFALPGPNSGTLLYSKTHFVGKLSSNTVTHISNSTVPWVGKDVTLYRVQTFEASTEKDSPLRCSSSITRSRETTSLAEYWLSDWTTTTTTNLKALGVWRDDTSKQVKLKARAAWCGKCLGDQVRGLCQSAGCSTSEIVLHLENPKDKLSNGDDDDDYDSTIAFGVWTELQWVCHDNRMKNVLPTLYSNGLFSILKQEERFVCMEPLSYQEQQTNITAKRMQISISGWNVQTMTIPLPPQQCDESVLMPQVVN
eukprot:scaffold6632_cov102-Cylindrotheca_fusiformis.AAC.4